MVGEWNHVGDGGFEVEVKPVDYGCSEGTGNGGRGFRTEDGPEVSCCCDSSGRGGETAFGVGGSTNREENGFSIGGLAGCNVLSGEVLEESCDRMRDVLDLRAVEEIGSRDRSAIVAGIGEVQGWIGNGD